MLDISFIIEESKYCKFFNKEKPIKDFVKDGFCVKNICKECNRERQKEKYRNSKIYYQLQQEKKELIDYLKEKIAECNKELVILEEQEEEMFYNLKAKEKEAYESILSKIEKE